MGFRFPRFLSLANLPSFGLAVRDQVSNQVAEVARVMVT
jgi:hypothetical protein